MSSCCTLIFLHSNIVLAERSIRKHIRFSMQQLVKHSSSTPTCRKIVELRKRKRKLHVEMASSSESTVKVLRDLDVSGSDGRTQWACSWLCRFLCTTNYFLRHELRLRQKGTWSRRGGVCSCICCSLVPFLWVKSGAVSCIALCKALVFYSALHPG